MKDALSFHLKCEVINYNKNNLFIIKDFILVIQTAVHVFFLLTILNLKYWRIFRQGKLEVRTRKNLGDLYKWKSRKNS